MAERVGEGPAAAEAPGGPGIPKVLFVCTANRCRSPYMHLVFGDLMGLAASGWRIESAGTQAVDGEPIAAPMIEILAGHGIDGSAFRSRALSTGLIASATMILTADREQAGRVCRQWPSALRRVFTLRQAARLLSTGSLVDQIDPSVPGQDRIGPLVAAMAGERGRTGPARADDEVIDPWGKSADTYLKSVRSMYPALEQLADAMR